MRKVIFLSSILMTAPFAFSQGGDPFMDALADDDDSLHDKSDYTDDSTKLIPGLEELLIDTEKSSLRNQEDSSDSSSDDNTWRLRYAYYLVISQNNIDRVAKKLHVKKLGRISAEKIFINLCHKHRNRAKFMRLFPAKAKKELKRAEEMTYLLSLYANITLSKGSDVWHQLYEKEIRNKSELSEKQAAQRFLAAFDSKIFNAVPGENRISFVCDIMQLSDEQFVTLLGEFSSLSDKAYR